MGLDQYLYIRRVIPKQDEERIAVAAGASPIAVRMTSGEDDGVYLSMHDHVSEHERAKATRVVQVAGLEPFIGRESKSVMLRRADDRFVVMLQVAYWRKANSIHRWFVEKIQDGVDECEPSRPITATELQELVAACEKGLAAFAAGDVKLAGDTVSPMSGFFFGSTEVNSYWADDLSTTIAKIKPLLALLNEHPGIDVFYRSSW
jgi:hypothetical protein